MDGDVRTSFRERESYGSAETLIGPCDQRVFGRELKPFEDQVATSAGTQANSGVGQMTVRTV